MKTIRSRQNPEIMSLVALAHSKDERTKQRKFVAEGLRTCITLLKNNMRLVRLYIREDVFETVQKHFNTAHITLVAAHVMDKISLASNASGIFGVFHIPAAPEASLLKPGLVLANVTDPGNMGTLMRTCAAMNVSSMVIVEGCDPWNPKVVQASAGTIGNLVLFRWSWQELIANKGSLPLYALVVQQGQKPSAAHNNGLLVVGNEAHGIKAEWLASCDTQLTIPMPGDTESLNASVAGSLALYLVFGT